MRRLMRSAESAEREGLRAEAEARFREALAALDRLLGFARRPPQRPAAAGGPAGAVLSGPDAASTPAAEDFVDPVPRGPSRRTRRSPSSGCGRPSGRGGLREEHQDLAARLGSAHPGNAAIQQAPWRGSVLMLERTDYPALRSYRRVCDAQGGAPRTSSAPSLARLLRKDGRSDEWAQRIYSQATGGGPAGRRPAAGGRPASGRPVPERGV
ncbi:MAG: hypothetical protein MZV70_19885 [Desulfobacterales bacterium]|nr:hypothetical protein [Desulfobacterales bacterium]